MLLWDLGRGGESGTDKTCVTDDCNSIIYIAQK